MAVQTHLTRLPGLASIARHKTTKKKAFEEWEQRIDPKTGEYMYVNTATKEVSSKQPEWYIPHDKVDSPLVKFIKFDLVGDYDIRGKKLAAVLLAIFAVGMAIDYKRQDGLFFYLLDPQEREIVAESRKSDKERIAAIDSLDDEFEYEYVIDDDQSDDLE